jgi:hypothetical protein
VKLDDHLMYGLVALNGADAGLTAAGAALVNSGIEGNPAMRLGLTLNPVLFLALKLGVLAFAASYHHRNPDRRRAYVLAGLVAVYSVVVVRNLLIFMGIWR